MGNWSLGAMEPTAWLPMQQGPKGEHMVRVQEQSKTRRRHHRHAADEAGIEPIEHGLATTSLKRDLDQVLDEIDSALEENAKGSVQRHSKGDA
jgi:ubiquitin-like protein Pup